MRKERIAAVKKVTDAFLSAERTVELGSVQVAKCIAAIIEARVEANLPLDTAADSLQLIAEASIEQLNARKKMLAAHTLLRDIPAQIGVHTVDYGDTGCPPNNPFVQGSADLKIVG